MMKAVKAAVEWKPIDKVANSLAPLLYNLRLCE